MSKASGTLRLTLSPRLDELTRIRDELDRYLRDSSLPDNVRSALLVVAEEILTNIVHYGCYDEASDPVEVTVDQEDRVVHMEFIDSGIAFNPLTDAGRSTAGQLVDRQEPGGLGMRLVRELTNSREYTRKDDRNHFRVTKHVLPPK